MDLNQYKKKIQDLEKYAIKHGIPKNQVEKEFKMCLKTLKATSSVKATICQFFKFCSYVCFGILICILILYNHPQTHNVLLRNLQNFIYPGLRIFRKAAIPVISTYPYLSGKN